MDTTGHYWTVLYTAGHWTGDADSARGDETDQHDFSVVTTIGTALGDEIAFRSAFRCSGESRHSMRNVQLYFTQLYSPFEKAAQLYAKK